MLTRTHAHTNARTHAHKRKRTHAHTSVHTHSQTRETTHSHACKQASYTHTYLHKLASPTRRFHSTESTWPLWQQPQGPFNPPRVTTGWESRLFTAEELISWRAACPRAVTLPGRSGPLPRTTVCKIPQRLPRECHKPLAHAKGRRHRTDACVRHGHGSPPNLDCNWHKPLQK